ncbi:MAG TPA: hypothetical protein DCY17_04440 [Clostridiales bacterium]|nr:hypothetical protein [Clostridiales bacterium]
MCKNRLSDAEPPQYRTTQRQRRTSAGVVYVRLPPFLAYFLLIFIYIMYFCAKIVKRFRF